MRANVMSHQSNVACYLLFHDGLDAYCVLTASRLANSSLQLLCGCYHPLCCRDRNKPIGNVYLEPTAAFYHQANFRGIERALLVNQNI